MAINNIFWQLEKCILLIWFAYKINILQQRTVIRFTSAQRGKKLITI
jgi:hypothetical protein